MTGDRPYAAMHAKGEERRQRILTVAQRLLTRHGWRGTTLSLIAREAGVSAAGVLHHFESKEHLLEAVLDSRDADDSEHVNMSDDLVRQIELVVQRYERSPQLIGTFVVLLAENLTSGAPQRARLLDRYQASVAIAAQAIRRGQREGLYRADLDPAVKAVEIIAFIHGMETSWLLDPSIPLADVFEGYAASLTQQLTPVSPPR